MTIFQRTGNWFLPRRNRPYPAAVKALFELVPGLQEFRRKFVFEYGESLTAMIRHPRTPRPAGSRPLDGLHADAAEGPRAAA